MASIIDNGGGSGAGTGIITGVLMVVAIEETPTAGGETVAPYVSPPVPNS
jgi:hypothetical protein